MRPSRQFAHIINPVALAPTSDLGRAQPVTFESMRIARDFAADRCAVQLLTAQYVEDRGVAPAAFEATPDLDRSVLDLGSFHVSRKLPLVADILQRMYAAADAEYLIYTNVDIALMPHFYATVTSMIDGGIDACIINRRTISTRHTDVAELPMMYAQAGERHPGYDCFVFRREAVPHFELGSVCIGVPLIGQVLAANMICFSKNFEELADSHLTFHLGNDRQWQNPLLRDYAEHNASQAAMVFQRLAPHLKHAKLPRVTMSPLKEFIEQARKRPAT